ncbi:ABC transporter ATP-binding protein [Alkalicoccobacillus murimartini]|uniref:NitT/TauT family transport system ATP-binding protein n=1 Tax=Alkalicoccobacillus murimartini TaxID=171685 RepID=A0ABT9YHI9_9BACI|nr:ABC transporter ATP-binding protein [Alkalicoccobacillus murimartini]MDQ0207333.1 NitT/TauT family transport system ATP-binding protein [Alkalicoccobacillus murimartini]
MSLVVSDVNKSFGDDESKKHVLKNVSFVGKENEFICILGHSGCGKSTLLNLLAGFAKPDEGTIKVNNTIVSGPHRERGVVFQEHALFPWYTVLDNIAMGPSLEGRSKSEARKIATTYLELVGLSECANQYPSQLSGGMKQRVGIARALANKPNILLMDEPFGALDILTRETMRRELLSIWMKLKTMVIFVTHSIDEAVYLADRVLVMKDGEVALNKEITLERPRKSDHSEFISISKELQSLLETINESNKGVLT